MNYLFQAQDQQYDIIQRYKCLQVSRSSVKKKGIIYQEYYGTYQAKLKAKALLTACRSTSSSLSGSNINAFTTIPINPPCLSCTHHQAHNFKISFISLNQLPIYHLNFQNFTPNMCSRWRVLSCLWPQKSVV